MTVPIEPLAVVLTVTGGVAVCVASGAVVCAAGGAAVCVVGDAGVDTARLTTGCGLASFRASPANCSARCRRFVHKPSINLPTIHVQTLDKLANNSCTNPR